MKCKTCKVNEGSVNYMLEKDGSVYRCRCGDPIAFIICSDCIKEREMRYGFKYFKSSKVELLKTILHKGCAFLNYE